MRGSAASALRRGVSRGRDALDVGGHGGGLAAGLGGGGDHGHGQLRIAGLAAAAAWACCAVSGTGARGVGVTSLAFNALTSTAAVPLAAVIAGLRGATGVLHLFGGLGGDFQRLLRQQGLRHGLLRGGDRHRAGLGLGGLLDGFVDGAGRGVLGMASGLPPVLPGAGSLAPLPAGRASFDWVGRCWASTSEKLGPLLSDTEDLAPKASAGETGADGAMAGRGRGAFILGFLWYVA